MCRGERLYPALRDSALHRRLKMAGVRGAQDNEHILRVRRQRLSLSLWLFHFGNSLINDFEVNIYCRIGYVKKFFEARIISAFPRLLLQFLL
jgi:hypothetical protein